MRPDSPFARRPTVAEVKNIAHKACYLWAGALSLSLISSPSLAQATLCNSTNGDISIAIKMDRTRGWWNLRPQQCQEVVSTPLTGQLLSIYTEPPTRVQGARGEPGRTFSWCVKNERFDFVDAPLGCPIPFRSAAFVGYDVKIDRIRWNLEFDPSGFMKTQSVRGAGRGARVQLPDGASRPRLPLGWNAYIAPVEAALTSKSGRKDHEFSIDSDPYQSVCTYRVREISNIGDANHWNLTNAYTRSADLTMSVKPPYTSVGGGWAEVHDGSRASLKVEIDWYMVDNRAGMPLPHLHREVNSILDMDRDTLNLDENAHLRAAFQGGLWPADVRCGDRPAQLLRARNSYPAPMPTFGEVVQLAHAALRVHCVRTDDGTFIGAEHDLRGAGTTCEEARSRAQALLRENRCRFPGDGSTHTYRRNGTAVWLATSTCAKPQ